MALHCSSFLLVTCDQFWLNSSSKYADDASLLVPTKTDVAMFEEFSNIIKWSADNKLTVNLARTAEIVFPTPNPTNYLPPVELVEIERVDIAKLLGSSYKMMWALVNQKNT